MVKPRQSSRGHTQVVDPQSVKTIHAWSAGLCHIVSTAASSQDCVLHLWVFEHMAYSSPSKIKSICNSECHGRHYTRKWLQDGTAYLGVIVLRFRE